MKHLFALALGILLVAASRPAYGQVADTLRPSPNVTSLRKIWVKEGERENSQFGNDFGGLGDIYGIGRAAWAISSNLDSGWRIYLWDTALQAPIVVQSFPKFKSGNLRQPVVGNFYGTGHNVLGMATSYIDSVVNLENYQLYFFRSDSNRLDTVPSAIFNGLHLSPFVDITPSVVRAADLDNDGDDELIIFVGGAGRDSVRSRKPEVWIYKGGPDFQVDTPTVILHDTEANGGRGYRSMFVGDIDGDHRPDIITSSDYDDRLGIQKLKFYFSHDGAPWNWTTPEREVVLANLSYPLPVELDCTGDGVLDIALARTARVDLYRSNAGKDIHTRSFDSTDADNTYLWNGFILPAHFGYLNDSSRRYEMLDIYAGSDRGLAGAPTGPNAHYVTSNGDILVQSEPVGDVTGDGWEDLMSSRANDNFSTGVVNLFAGGPYIPRDPSLGVRTVATPERSDALHIWPNPVRTELHIAWRGDLKQMPRGFAIHDITGREVWRGVVESWRGEALWNCTGVPAGTYLLSIYDYTDNLITTTSITKY